MTNEQFEAALNMLIKGEKEGLKQIYQAYIKLIYSVVLNLVGRKEDAEDITSEFFIKLINVAGTFKAGQSHKTWMVTIARNMSIDFLRKAGRELLINNTDEDSDSDKAIDDISAKDRTSRAGMVQSEVENKAILAEDMRTAMNNLSEKEKEIVHMKLIGNMKFQEISDTLGQPIGTVSWIYNQGIKKLRRCLSSYERE